MNSRALLHSTWLILFSVGLSGCVETVAVDSPRLAGDSGTDVAGNPTRTTGASTDAASVGPASATSFVDGAQTVATACRLAPDEIQWEAEVLRLTNIERTQRGLSALRWNGELARQADDYACEMIEGDFFAHVNPATGDGLRERANTFDYEFWAVGENLAGGQTTPAQAVREWMDSPDHRENILNPAFTELGVGVRLGGDYRVYWVQEFGRPIADGPVN